MASIEIVIKGTSGNDKQQGSKSNDVFIASVGNDVMEGKQGNDIYHWGPGMGNDIIIDTMGDDIIKFTDPGITGESLEIYSYGDNNLYIKLKQTGEILTVKNHFLLNKLYMVEKIEFADGSSLDLTDNIDFKVKNNKILRVKGSDRNDVLYCANNTVLDGGKGYDIFIWTAGIGNCKIHDILNNGMLKLEGLKQDDVEIYSYGDKNFYITIKATNETLTLVEHFLYKDSRTAKVTFADGVVLSLEQGMHFKAKNDQVTDIYGSRWFGDVMHGGVKLTMHGDEQDDSYLWGKNMDGAVIFDKSGAHDRIILLDDLRKADLDIFTKGDGNLYITIIKTNETLTIRNHLSNPHHAVEHLYFSDGDSVSLVGDNLGEL